MATLVTKNSSTASAVPLAANLVQGELAVNVTDKRLFTQNASDQVVEVGTNPSSLTLPNGTANGVAYLNGSKVLTTGSALTFDGTNFGVGTGGNTLNQQSVVYKVGANAVYQQIANGSTGLGAVNGIRIGLTSAGVGEWYSPTSAIYYIDNSEQMRLTSTGLGIGTSSPGVRLDVAGNTRVTNSNPRIDWRGATRTYYWQVVDADNRFRIVDETAGGERLTLDTSGNLGLGVTPSAWFSSYKALQISSNGSLTSNTDFFAFSNNAFVNSSGNDIYLTTGFAGRYRHMASSGAHQWFTAPSGTAGNPINFTQAMTLFSSATRGTLDVNGVSDSIYTLSAAGTRRAYLHYNGTEVVLANETNNPMLFLTNATERARITSGGNLLVGSTADSIARIRCEYSGQAFGIRVGTTATTGSAIQFVYEPGTQVGTITTTTTSTAYNTSSDYRLKNISGPVTNSGAYIDSLRPVEGTWREDGSTFVGLIAHEAQEASRTPVATGTKDGEQMQAMDYGNSEFIANIIAELQSLRARVAHLETQGA